MLELLFIGFLVGVTGAAASSGGSNNEDSDDEENTNVDLSKYFHDDFKSGNHLTQTRYWENSTTGDYIKHKIDIDIE